MRRLSLAALLAAALILLPAAPAAAQPAPGTYGGWLYSAKGKRLKDARASLSIRGGRVALAVVNMRARCPYPGADGGPARLRVRATWRGQLKGDRVDGVASVQRGASELHLRGRFTNRRFRGRLTLRPAEGVAGACSASHRVIGKRKRR